LEKKRLHQTLFAMSHSIHDTRKDYQKGAIDVSALPKDPIVLLQQWLKDAQNTEGQDYNAMSLATLGDEGIVSNRIVLLRDIDEGNLRFFTNYTSRKGKSIDKNPSVSALFFWPTLERQIRINGRAQRSTADVSDTYFNSRPRASQLGAWASNQSAAGEEDALMKRLEELSKKYEYQEVPRPDFWGGFDIEPFEFEFWQGRPSRLHQRFSYSKSRQESNWSIQRLDP
jgi:pyridoxamine 5'-phosphate oxidase